MVESEDDVLQLLWTGAQNRAISATDMNEHSSRSHTVFQLVVEEEEEVENDNLERLPRRGKLNLVDLAGSEKWKSHQLAEFSEKRIQELTSM